MGSLLLWPDMLREKRTLAWHPLKLYLGLIAVQFVSLIWSPEPIEGLKYLAYLLPFVLIVVAAKSVASAHPRIIVWTVLVFALGALVEAALVILFQLRPDLENQFLQSSIAGVFITPNELTMLFDQARNNVLDEGKAGGFFINANRAACFLGIAALVVWGFAGALRSRLLKIVGTVLWVSVFFTGSKAAAALAVATLMMTWFAPALLPGSRALPRIKVMFGALVLVAAVTAAAMNTEYSQGSRATFDERQLIWAHAQEQFRSHPLAGLGFGGWQLSFAVYAAKVGLNTNYPPHNTLVFIWSQSGLIAALIAAGFMLSVLRFGVRAYRAVAPEARALPLAMTMAFFWTFIQGMGENFGIVGEMHMQPLLALALGTTYSLCDGTGSVRRFS
ncbi:MAG: O-antigen ligase family protein [Pseudomonadota bacterium]